jgi:solute carrier family 8 (sodium/calcium exchanger)
VTMVDDDDGGILVFELPTWEAGSADECAAVVVIRRNGSDGKVMVDYNTKDGTAVGGTQFSATSGQLVFQSGETRKLVQVPLLLPSASPDLLTSILAFRIVLSNPMGGVSIGARKECRVVIVPGTKLDLVSKSKSGKLIAGSKSGHGVDFDSSGDVGSVEEDSYDLWREWETKFQDAILPEFDTNDGGSVWVAMLLHYISFTFKVLAACCPPAEWRGGYPQFACSIAMLGGLMAIVKEVAQMFGCALGLSDLMTGMSIVALGEWARCHN